MSEQQDKSALPVGTVVRGYRLLDVLGSGGFGVTYMAEDSETSERVAVKEYLPIQFAVRDGTTVHPKSEASRADFEWGLDRFLSEAGMLTRFRHPNIVQVKGYFEANNTAYIVMKYEEGEPLDKLLDRRGKLTEAQLKRVLLPIADGLRQVHARGVWHRDVKPANIFVRRSNESPVLLDFGAARNALGARSASMTAIVSPPYAPPEQYDSLGELGAYTDVYALSALCWRAITGELPPESPYRQRLAGRGEDPLPLLSEERPRGYSVALLRAVDWGLQLDERERPQSVEEWLDAMGEGEGLAMPSEPAPEPAPMPGERDPMPSAPADIPDNAEPEHVEAEAEESAEESANEGVFRKLVRGRYGLANTYWRFGVFGYLAFGVAVFVAAATGVQAVILPISLLFLAYWLVVMVGIWRAAGTYPGWKIWPLLARLVVLASVGMMVVSVFNGVRESVDWDGLLNMFDEVVGDTGGEPPTVRVGSLTIANRSTEEIAAVRAKPSARLRWGDNLVAGAPVLAGESRAVSLLGYGYGDQCRFDVRVEVAEEAHDVFEKDLCANSVVVFGRNGAFASWVERVDPAPFTIETVPPHARVRILNIAPAYQDDMRLGPGSYRIEVSAEGYETATESVRHGTEPTVRRVALREAGPKVGDRFRDCPECPEMVVLPAGSFRMGSPSHEDGRYDDEGPMHRVTIGAPFAVGRHEVTFGQWDVCVNDGECPRSEDVANDLGYGRGQHPVFSVSWEDAKRFVQWLSRKTKKPYRLLSESEWEYAARAGTETAYSWGDQIGSGLASCKGCGGQWDGRPPAPVGSFAANAWGLHDMHGNVWEWVEDCWNESYAGSSSDGSAWLGGNCSSRVLRGGSWDNGPSLIRAAARYANATSQRYTNYGFRVARTLGESTGPAPFKIETVPAHARVRILNIGPAYRDGMQLPPGSYRVEVTAEGYETATESVAHGAGPTVRQIVLRKTGPKVGDRFRDCAECPEMVVVPAGSYRMGSPSHEQGRHEDEGPVHEVTIAAPFAIGRYEVTVAEFRRFVDETEYSTGNSCSTYEGSRRGQRSGRGWRNPGFDQSGRHPVACVNWNDVRAYAAWLSRETGEEYRLPSESEWEYAARAGTATARYWGESVSGQCGYANGGDASLKDRYSVSTAAASCRDGHVHTAPVGSFAANGWGLYDMLGNVWEWTEDCWNRSYAGAPSDSRAWQSGNCSMRVMRGGAWYYVPSNLRAAFRYGDPAGNRWGSVGFRVVRTLTP